ncbi:AraC family transcriptional regulator [uncultured Alistipes sp.]|uniref:AraC family transcriptional regulator n=1 Tax=uncultured Alistipes sp. TaxID=538949 RepID=UPI0028058F12|nr:AraC family transcriptional regulator [uncultured Alistipes sp.]
MKNSTPLSAQQPMIVKYVETLHNGIQSQALSRYAIGYVLRGTKYVYDGDKRQAFNRGDVFYLGLGHHYVENVPENGQPFEQVLFYYTPADLQRILLHLNITYGLNISNDHTCENCHNRPHVAMPAWNSLRNFFVNTNNYLRDESFLHDETAENIKMTELIYLISSHEDCCIKSKLLGNIDTARENFEQTVYDHIFKDISIEELARLTNRSLTSFKKEFRRHFQMPPHKWYIRQRLMHSRLLLISTSKSISEIGVECTFPNTSHFIKLFKKEYRMTPAAYRSRHLHSNPEGDTSLQQHRAATPQLQEAL